MTPSLTLFIDRFWISPYSFSSYVALVEKEVSFEVSEVSLEQKQQRTAEYKKISYTGRVPSLTVGDFHLAESSAIAEFLEDSFPSQGVPLFPSNVRQRALARMIMAWLRSDFSALRVERPTHTMFYEKATKPLSAAAESDASQLIEFCERMTNGKNILFDQWSLADAELSFMLHRLILNGHDLSAGTLHYATSNWKRKSVLEFTQHIRPQYIPY